MLGGGVGVVRAILNFSLFFIGMCPTPALPWYSYTPGRLPYETERAACRKFRSKPLTKRRLI